MFGCPSQPPRQRAPRCGPGWALPLSLAFDARAHHLPCLPRRHLFFADLHFRRIGSCPFPWLRALGEDRCPALRARQAQSRADARTSLSAPLLSDHTPFTTHRARREPAPAPGAPTLTAVLALVVGVPCPPTSDPARPVPLGTYLSQTGLLPVWPAARPAPVPKPAGPTTPRSLSTKRHPGHPRCVGPQCAVQPRPTARGR